MKIELKTNKGLTREFKVVVPAADIASKKLDYIKSRAGRVKIDGFRPGKAPYDVLEQRLGDEAMNHIFRASVENAIRTAVKDHEIRQAGEPDIQFDKFEDGKDLSFSMVFETLPDVKLNDFSKLEVEKLVVEVPETEIEKTLKELHGTHKSFQPVEKARSVKNGDRATCELSLALSGKPLKNYQKVMVTVDVGSETLMIDSVDDQLKKMKEGDQSTFKAKVAANFGDVQVAGKEVDVTLAFQKHLESKTHKIDDAFAQEFGKKDLAELKEQLRSNLQENFDGIARLYLKRRLLDALEKENTFDLPQVMVTAEFDSIWGQLQQEIEQAKAAGDYDNKDEKPEAELRKEYQGIAERRVKLGLVISEVARAEKIQLSQEELRTALYREAMRYPGQEKEVMQYFRKHPQTIDRVAAPLLEDKVVDYIVTKIKTKDVKVDVNGLKKKVKGVVPTLFDDEDESSNKAA